MNVKAFQDTNIIVHAFSSNDPRTNKAKASVHPGGIIGSELR
jgi:hypothetical protein